MLSMLVTFSTGFGKSTTDLKQKSKTEIIAFDIVKSVVINSVIVDTKIVNDVNSFQTLDIENNSSTLLNTVLDVGWRKKTINQKKFPHFENVMSIKELYHINKNKLRTNPKQISSQFDNSILFKISIRY